MQETDSILQKVAAAEPCVWFSPNLRPAREALAAIPYTRTNVRDAAERLARFAPYIERCFPETAADGGLIESPLTEIPHMAALLRETEALCLPGRMFLKRDSDLAVAGSVKARGGIYEVLKQMIKACKAVRFDGNGYSEEWRAEAARRGLDCETCAPRVFDRYLDPSSVEMFARMGVLSKVELEARTEVKWETYTKKIQIEGRVLGDLTMNHIVPIASRYEALLLDKVYKISQIGQGLDASADVELIKRIQQHTALIQQLTHDMIEARKVANKIEDQREKALAYHDTVAVYFDQIRKHVDRLEEIVDDQMWPLPKYRELLFLR